MLAEAPPWITTAPACTLIVTLRAPAPAAGAPAAPFAVPVIAAAPTPCAASATSPAPASRPCATPCAVNTPNRAITFDGDAIPRVDLNAAIPERARFAIALTTHAAPPAMPCTMPFTTLAPASIAAEAHSPSAPAAAASPETRL